MSTQRPVFELTLDEAVAELDQVADTLLGEGLPIVERRRLTDRKHQLETWVLMKQGPVAAEPPIPEEVSMPALKFPSRSPEEGLDDRVAEIQEAQARLTGLPDRAAFKKRRQAIYDLRNHANLFAKQHGLDTPIFPPMPPDPFKGGKSGSRSVPRVTKESAKQRGLPVELEPQAPVSAEEARHLQETCGAIDYRRDTRVVIPADEALTTLQTAVLAVTQDAIRWTPEQRAAHLTAAANLDALAHQLAGFLAHGRIEVSA